MTQNVVIRASDFYQPVDASIVINSEAERLVAYINGDKFELNLSLSDIEDVNRDLNFAAQKLVAALQRGISGSDLPIHLLDPEDGLAARGHAALNNIFGQSALQLLRMYLKGISLPVLEIRSDIFLVPWDWLYESPPQDVGVESEVLEVVQNFWGVSRIVARRRVPRQSVSAPLDLHYRANIRQRPRVGLLVDNNLIYAQQEQAWLRSVAAQGLIDLVEFAPVGAPEDVWGFIPQINHFLSEPFDIIHFACHAEADESNRLKSFLRVCNDQKYEVNYLNLTPPVRLQEPVVFFNACSTGVRKPLGTFDFVKAFWDRGARNIIAVESSIEGRVAESLARYFYAALLDGKQIGAALHQARSNVLQGASSALEIVSLFYSLYADPRLRVENGQPDDDLLPSKER